MDKKLIEILMNKGYITTYVNADMYKDVDDLFNKGVITIPGSKTAIMELLDLKQDAVEHVITENDDNADDNEVINNDNENNDVEPTVESEPTVEPVKKTAKKTKKTE